MRVGEELRGSSASLRRAAKRSSAGSFRSDAMSFSRLRLAAYCAASLRRRLFFSTELVLAIHISQRPFGLTRGPLAAERKIETTKQLARFVVGAGGGADHNVHAPDLVDLVV